MRYLLLSILFFCQASFAATTGKAAPGFELSGHDGKTYKLSDFKGKVVVLEWLNHGCPYVKKHYQSGNMQKLQKKYTDKDVVWLSVISSAEGKQGHVDAKGAESDMAKHKSNATKILLDPQGKVGQSYSAKTTPHMYVINQKGLLAYQGAIDSIPSYDQGDIAKATNYVSAAVDSVLKNEKVKIAQTKAYGCSVKYKD